MAYGIRKSFKKAIITQLFNALYMADVPVKKDKFMTFMKENISSDKVFYSDSTNYSEECFVDTWKEVRSALGKYLIPVHIASFKPIYKLACESVEEETHQAMEAVIHNFNSLHSRAGAQTPFSSINFGTDTSPEGRLATKEILNAIDAGLGNGETPIFPVSIFQIKEGVNYNPEDPNYDLFIQACKVSAKRLLPNFVNEDSSFNAPYYKEGNYNSLVAVMGLVKNLALPFEPCQWVSQCG